MLPEMKITKTLANAVMPAYAHDGDSGMDLATPVDLMLEPGIPCFVDIGIAIELPAGHEGQIRSRSGLTKKGLTACSGIGTVDNSYRGSIGVTLLWHGTYDNLGNGHWNMPAGTRIAQLVVCPVARVRLVEVSEVEQMSNTERGDGGFGSTDAKKP